MAFFKDEYELAQDPSAQVTYARPGFIERQTLAAKAGFLDQPLVVAGMTSDALSNLAYSMAGKERTTKPGADWEPTWKERFPSVKFPAALDKPLDEQQFNYYMDRQAAQEASEIAEYTAGGKLYSTVPGALAAGAIDPVNWVSFLTGEALLAKVPAAARLLAVARYGTPEATAAMQATVAAAGEGTAAALAAETAFSAAAPGALKLGAARVAAGALEGVVGAAAYEAVNIPIREMAGLEQHVGEDLAMSTAFGMIFDPFSRYVSSAMHRARRMQVVDRLRTKSRAAQEALEDADFVTEAPATVAEARKMDIAIPPDELIERAAIEPLTDVLGKELGDRLHNTSGAASVNIKTAIIESMELPGTTLREPLSRFVSSAIDGDFHYDTTMAKLAADPEASGIALRFFNDQTSFPDWIGSTARNELEAGVDLDTAMRMADGYVANELPLATRRAANPDAAAAADRLGEKLSDVNVDPTIAQTLLDQNKSVAQKAAEVAEAAKLPENDLRQPAAIPAPRPVDVDVEVKRTAEELGLPPESVKVVDTAELPPEVKKATEGKAVEGFAQGEQITINREVARTPEVARAKVIHEHVHNALEALRKSDPEKYEAMLSRVGNTLTDNELTRAIGGKKNREFYEAQAAKDGFTGEGVKIYLLDEAVARMGEAGMPTEPKWYKKLANAVLEFLGVELKDRDATRQAVHEVIREARREWKSRKEMADAGTRNWWDARYEKSADISAKADVLERAADRTKNATEADRILAKLEELDSANPEFSGSARVAYALLLNENASANSRLRAAAIYEKQFPIPAVVQEQLDSLKAEPARFSIKEAKSEEPPNPNVEKAKQFIPFIDQFEKPTTGFESMFFGRQLGKIKGVSDGVTQHQDAYYIQYVQQPLYKLENLEVNGVKVNAVDVMRDPSQELAVIKCVENISLGKKSGGTAEHAAIAKIIFETDKTIADRSAQLGVPLGVRDWYIGHMSWDADMLKRQGEAAFMADMNARIDASWMSARGVTNLAASFKQGYQNLVTGSHAKYDGTAPGTLAERMAASGVWKFKSAEDQYYMMKKYGGRSYLEALASSWAYKARSLGQIHVLTGDPKGFVSALVMELDKHYKELGDNTKVEELVKQRSKIDAMMDYVDGTTEQIINRKLHTFSEWGKVGMNLNSLPFAGLRSVPDVVISGAAAQAYTGKSFAHGVADMIRRAPWFYGLSKPEKLERLHMLGALTRSDIMGSLNLMTEMSNDGGSAVRQRISSFQHKYMTLLHLWVNGIRAGVTDMVSAQFGLYAGMKYADLPKHFYDFLDRYNVDESFWNAHFATSAASPDKYLWLDGVATPEGKHKYLQILEAERGVGTSQPGARQKYTMSAGLPMKKGTWAREILDWLLRYKSFMVSQFQLGLERMYSYEGQQSFMKALRSGPALKRLTAYGAYLSSAGAMSYLATGYAMGENRTFFDQEGDIDESLWVDTPFLNEKAVMQSVAIGGFFSGFGDVMLSKDWTTYILGPASRYIRLGSGTLGMIREGDGNAAGQAVRLAEAITPRALLTAYMQKEFYRSIADVADPGAAYRQRMANEKMQGTEGLYDW